jgi:MFS family permease
MPLPPAAAAVAVFVIGSGFGSTVSVFVMMLTRSYGTDRVGALFGRLNISYGLAGFLAPSITGWMYELSGDYTTSLWFGDFLGVLGLLAMAGNTDLSTQTSK